MKKKYLVILILAIVSSIAFLGVRLLINGRNQPATKVPGTLQPTNQNSQQGGPDTPGQPAAPESGAPGTKANN